MERVKQHTIYFFTTAFIIIALISLLLRGLLNLIPTYQNEITEWLSQQIDTPITVGSMELTWIRAEPVLKLSDIRVELEGDNQTVSAKELKVRFNFLKSFRLLTPTFKTLTVTQLSTPILLNEWLKQDDNSEFELADWVQALSEKTQIIIKDSSLALEHHQHKHSLRLKEVWFKKHQDTYHLNGIIFPGKGRSERSKIELNLRLSGKPQSPDKLESKGYIHVRELSLADWLNHQDVAKITDGVLDAKVWVKGEENYKFDIQSLIHLTDVKVKGKEPSQIISIPQAKFNSVISTKDGKTWEGVIAQELLQTAEIVWPNNQWQLKYTNESTEPKLIVQANYVDIESAREVSSLLTLGEEVETFLNTAEPVGRLKHFQLHLNQQNQLKFLEAQLSGISLKPWQDIPGIKELDGSIHFANQQGRAVLQTGQTQLTFKDLFRHPLALDGLSVPIEWSLNEQGKTIHIKRARLQLAGRGELVTDLALYLAANDKDSTMTIITDFTDMDGRKKSFYLPTGIMGKNLVNWLDKAITKTDIERGKLVFHGKLKDFPFEDHTGAFEVNAELKGLDLDYSFKWPRLLGADLSAKFTGYGMDLVVHRGVIANTPINHMTARIPNYESQEAVLHINGNMAGDASHLLNVVINSELNNNLGIRPGEYDLKGPAKTHLNLVIPIENSEDTIAKGEIELNKASIHIIDTPIKASELTGTIAFVNDDFTSKALKGQLFGEPVTLDIKTFEDRIPNEVELTVNGAIPEKFILSQTEPGSFNHQLAKRLTGKAKFNSLVKFISKSANQTELPQVSIKAESELKGLVINIPKPIGKAKEDALPVSLMIQYFRNDTRQADFSYGNVFNSRLSWAQKDPLSGKNKFDIQIGSTTQAELNQGSHLADKVKIQGKLPKIVLTEWIDFLSSLEHAPSSDETETAWFKQAELQFESVDVFGIDFPNLKLEVQSADDYWSVKPTSKMVEGLVKLSRGKTSSKPVLVELEHLSLPKVHNGKGDSIEFTEPSMKGPIHLSIGELIYDQDRIGRIEVKLLPDPKGIVFKDFALNRHNSVTKLDGIWTKDKTAVKGTSDSSSIAKELDSWNINSGLVRAPAKFEFDFEWPGNPSQFNLKELKGTLKGEIGKGRLVEVKPGATRILGLLTFQAVRRRITLDFSDLYKRGLSFDSITGNFKIDKGNALTCDTKLVGPSTSMTIKGRTGLITQDFDQVAYIALDLTGSLPLIVGAFNPIAGAATWIGNKLLENQINELTQLQYSIKGQWEDPQIEVRKTPSLLKPWEIIPSLIPPLRSKENMPQVIQDCE